LSIVGITALINGRINPAIDKKSSYTEKHPDIRKVNKYDIVFCYKEHLLWTRILKNTAYLLHMKKHML